MQQINLPKQSRCYCFFVCLTNRSALKLLESDVVRPTQNNNHISLHGRNMLSTAFWHNPDFYDTHKKNGRSYILNTRFINYELRNLPPLLEVRLLSVCKRDSLLRNVPVSPPQLQIVSLKGGRSWKFLESQFWSFEVLTKRVFINTFLKIGRILRDKYEIIFMKI